jgi:hypothetical protein
MFYKLLHKIFGWDYIVWTNTADSGIAQIRIDGAGRYYYWRYRVTRVADFVEGNTDIKLWLTCPPEKYKYK